MRRGGQIGTCHGPQYFSLVDLLEADIVGKIIKINRSKGGLKKQRCTVELSYSVTAQNIVLLLASTMFKARGVFPNF